MSVEKHRKLICACCGNNTIGRQWHDQDTGYGICGKCAQHIAEKDSVLENLEQSYGHPGRHFAVRLRANLPIGTLVWWSTIGSLGAIAHEGSLKEYDNGTALVNTSDGIKAAKAD